VTGACGSARARRGAARSSCLCERDARGLGRYIAGRHLEAVVNEASEAAPRGYRGPTRRDTDDKVRRSSMTCGDGVRCGSRCADGGNIPCPSQTSFGTFGIVVKKKSIN
jgi:hypothetical protein